MRAPRIAIGLAGYSAFLNLYAPQAILPMLARDLGADAAGISAIMTAGTLAVALIAPFAGAVADVIGRKRVIWVSILGVAPFSLVLPHVGLVGTVALMIGAYTKGASAIPLVLVLIVVFTFLWYLAGVVHARPTVNIAATLMAFIAGGGVVLCIFPSATVNLLALFFDFPQQSASACLNVELVRRTLLFFAC